MEQPLAILFLIFYKKNDLKKKTFLLPTNYLFIYL